MWETGQQLKQCRMYSNWSVGHIFWATVYKY